MPDPTQELYRLNKVAAKENLNILGNISTGNTYDKSFDYGTLEQPNVTGGTPSPVGDISQYEGYMLNPEAISAWADINAIRSQGQSVGEQLGHMAMRVIPNVLMGTVGNLASILDVEDYANVDDEVGNAISQTMSDWQDMWKAKNPIYRENPGTSFDMGDSGWWIDNISNLLDSAGAFALTGYISGGILGKVAKGLGSGILSPRAQAKIANRVSQGIAEEEAATGVTIDAATAQSRIQTAMANHISMLDKATVPMNAMALNQAESIMEGMGVYKDVYNQKLASGDDIETAKQKAADAASLDVNINRANILLNLTSAGMFTNANRAIRHSMGTNAAITAKESVQEAMEEGVNYVAQMESMQQAKDGANYQWDNERALGHLATAQGAESMFLGALGGGMQTAMTQALTGMKARANDAHQSLTATQTATNSANLTTAQATLTQSNNIKNWWNAKSTATTQQQHDDADNTFLTNTGENIYIHGHDKGGSEKAGQDIDAEIAEFDRIKNLDSAKEAERTGLEVSDIDEKKALAQKGFDELTRIKEVAERSNLESYPLNKSEVLRKNLELDKATRDRVNAQNVLTKKEAQLLTIDPNLTAEELASRTTVERTLLDANQSREDGIKQELSAIISTANQDRLNALEMARKQKEIDDAEEAKVNAVVSNIPPPKPITPAPAIVSDINSALPKVRLGDDIKPIGEEPIRELSEQQFATANNNSTDPSIVLDENGKDGYIIIPPAPLDSNPEIITPAKTVRIGKNSDGSLQIVGAVKDAFAHTDRMPGSKVTIGDKKFDRAEFNSFLDGKVDKNNQPKSSNNFTRSDVLEFLNSKTITTVTNEAIVPNHETEDVSEPQEDPTEEQLVVAEDGGLKSTKRAIASALNYLAETYKIIEGKIIGIGEVNQQYLINSNRDLVHTDAEIIIRPYTENQVPTTNYRYEKDIPYAIVDENGNKSTTLHDANSASAAGKEIPIGIYLKNKNGSEGQLIGFLPENDWMNEGGSGRRYHLAEENVDLSDSLVQQVSELRSYITEQFETNKGIKIESKIQSVSAGKPFVNKEGFQLTEKALPDIIADRKGQTVFGHINNGTVWANGNPVNGVVNEEVLADPSLTGRPVVLLPIGDGTVYAMIVKSSSLQEVGSVGHVMNAVKAFIGINKNGASIYDSYAAKNGLESIKTHEGLRDYLKTFFNMNATSDWGNTSIADKNAISVFEKTSNGNTIIKFGTIHSANPSVINLNSIMAMLASGNPESIAKANESLKQLNDFVGLLRHNFVTGNLNSKAKVIGITEGGIVTIAENIQQRYMKTIQTNVIPAGKSEGKNVYMVQPVVEIDTTIPSAPVRPAGTLSVGEQVTLTFNAMSEGAKDSGARDNFEKMSRGDEIVYSNPAAIEMVKKNPLYNIEILSDGKAKVIGVKNPETGEWLGIQPQTKPARVKKIILPTTGDGAILPDANVSSSIALEQAASTEQSPLANIDPNDTDSMGEALIKYCKG